MARVIYVLGLVALAAASKVSRRGDNPDFTQSCDPSILLGDLDCGEEGAEKVPHGAKCTLTCGFGYIHDSSSVKCVNGEFIHLNNPTFSCVRDEQKCKPIVECSLYVDRVESVVVGMWNCEGALFRYPDAEKVICDRTPSSTALNPITVIKRHAFRGISFDDSLIYWTTSYLLSIEPEAFSGLVARTFMLTTYRLTTISERAFSGIRVDTLYLWTNGLTNIASEAFTNSKVGTTVIDSFELDTIESNAFTNTYDCGTIKFSYHSKFNNHPPIANASQTAFNTLWGDILLPTSPDCASLKFIRPDYILCHNNGYSLWTEWSACSASRGQEGQQERDRHFSPNGIDGTVETQSRTCQVAE